MNIAKLFCAGVCLLIPGAVFAQVSPPGAPAVEPKAPAALAPPAADAADPTATPAEIETVPSLEQESDLPASPEVESGATATPAVEEPATEPAQQTEAMPNAVTSEAQPAPTANAPKHKDFSWRYRWYGGRWWYWMPNKSWMIWEGTRWTKYSDYLARFDSRYRNRRVPGHTQPQSGPYYNGPSSSGYRGTSTSRYYNEYRPVWAGEESDYGPAAMIQPQGHDYWPGWTSGLDNGSYNSPLNSGTFQGGLGAGAGGGIGAAAVAGS